MLDARVRYTKMVILNTFLKLLKKKPVNKITVKEICDLAEINRATFYKYYLDVYNLLEILEDQFLDELKKILTTKINTGVKDVFTIIMVSFKAEEDKYKIICSENGDPSFPNKVFETCYNCIQPQHKIKLPNLSVSKREQLYQFVVHGCNGILANWINNGMKETISDVSDFAEQLINKVITY